VVRFLPRGITAADLSGTLWHGSAGRLGVYGRDAGAIEWHLHPAALLRLALAADVHWVKVGFVIDAAVTADRQSFTARDLHGAGSLGDLRDFGLAPGWRGGAEIAFSELKSDYVRLSSVTGDIKINGVASPQVAGGAELGSYVLVLRSDAIDAQGNISAQLADTGGPLEVQAQIHYSPAERSGILAGTLRERAGAPPELRTQLDNLAQLKPRDAQGRIPAELEFRF
jgi:type II secretion system (T2SS) protein N